MIMAQWSLSLPQWSRIPVDVSLHTLTGTTWASTTALTQHPVYGGLFRVTPDTLFLVSGGYVSQGTPSLPLVISDNSGENYTVNLSTFLPTFSVSSNITTYQYDSATSLPIRLSAPQSASGSFITNRSVEFPTSLEGTFQNNGYFTPTLPVGLSSVTDSFGNVTIAGTPSTVRSNFSNFTYTASSVDGRQISQPVSLRVLQPRFVVSNVSGFLSQTVNEYAPTFATTVPYESSADVQLSITPTPSSVTLGTLPSGLFATLSGGILRIQGTLNAYLPVDGFTTSVGLSNTGYSTPLSLKFAMKPTVIITNVPSSITGFSNVPYSGFFTANAQTYPIAGRSVTWSLSGPTGLFVGPTTGIVQGQFSNAGTAVLTAEDSLGNRANASFSAIPRADSVTFEDSQIPRSFPLTAQVNFSSLSYAAFSESGRSLTYTATSISSTVTLADFGITLGKNTGALVGTPLNVVPQTSFRIRATTPEGIFSEKLATFVANADQVTFDPSANFQTLSAIFIEGRDIALDYTEVQRTFVATSSSGREITTYESYDLSGTGLSISNQTLVGTPLRSITDCNIQIVARTADGNSGTVTFPLVIRPQTFIILDPPVRDFVIARGQTQIVPITAVASGGESIVSYSLCGAPIGVSITPKGVLNLTPLNYTPPAYFAVYATTEYGSTLSAEFSVTVNSSIASFTNPKTPDVLFTLARKTVSLTTFPAGSVDVSSLVTGIRAETEFPPYIQTLFADPYLEWDTNTYIYPPQPMQLKTRFANLNYPLRVRTSGISVDRNEVNTNWTQYVNIEPIQFSFPGVDPATVGATVVGLPGGLRFDPIRFQILGAPRELSLGDEFVLYASDGFTVASNVISWRSVVPTPYKRFGDGSAYTQYVRQRAIVNSAVHAYGNNAYLPDALITSEGGPYPGDVTQAYYCKVCRVTHFVPPDDGGGGEPVQTTWIVPDSNAWSVTSNSFYHSGSTPQSIGFVQGFTSPNIVFRPFWVNNTITCDMLCEETVLPIAQFSDISGVGTLTVVTDVSSTNFTFNRNDLFGATVSNGILTYSRNGTSLATRSISGLNAPFYPAFTSTNAGEYVTDISCTDLSPIFPMLTPQPYNWAVDLTEGTIEITTDRLINSTGDTIYAKEGYANLPYYVIGTPYITKDSRAAIGLCLNNEPTYAAYVMMSWDNPAGTRYLWDIYTPNLRIQTPFFYHNTFTVTYSNSTFYVYKETDLIAQDFYPLPSGTKIRAAFTLQFQNDFFQNVSFGPGTPPPPPPIDFPTFNYNTTYTKSGVSEVIFPGGEALEFNTDTTSIRYTNTGLLENFRRLEIQIPRTGLGFHSTNIYSPASGVTFEGFTEANGFSTFAFVGELPLSFLDVKVRTLIPYTAALFKIVTGPPPPGILQSSITAYNTTTQTIPSGGGFFNFGREVYTARYTNQGILGYFNTVRIEIPVTGYLESFTYLVRSPTDGVDLLTVEEIGGSTFWTFGGTPSAQTLIDVEITLPDVFTRARAVLTTATPAPASFETFYAATNTSTSSPLTQGFAPTTSFRYNNKGDLINLRTVAISFPNTVLSTVNFTIQKPTTGLTYAGLTVSGGTSRMTFNANADLNEVDITINSPARLLTNVSIVITTGPPRARSINTRYSSAFSATTGSTQSNLPESTFARTNLISLQNLGELVNLGTFTLAIPQIGLGINYTELRLDGAVAAAPAIEERNGTTLLTWTTNRYVSNLIATVRTTQLFTACRPTFVTSSPPPFNHSTTFSSLATGSTDLPSAVFTTAPTCFYRYTNTGLISRLTGLQLLFTSGSLAGVTPTILSPAGLTFTGATLSGSGATLSFAGNVETSLIDIVFLMPNPVFADSPRITVAAPPSGTLTTTLTKENATTTTLPLTFARTNSYVANVTGSLANLSSLVLTIPQTGLGSYTLTLTTTPSVSYNVIRTETAPNTIFTVNLGASITCTAFTLNLTTAATLFSAATLVVNTVEPSIQTITTLNAGLGPATFTIPSTTFNKTFKLRYNNVGSITNFNRLLLVIPQVGLGTLTSTIVSPPTGIAQSSVTEVSGTTRITYTGNVDVSGGVDLTLTSPTLFSGASGTLTLGAPDPITVTTAYNRAGFSDSFTSPIIDFQGTTSFRYINNGNVGLIRRLTIIFQQIEMSGMGDIVATVNSPAGLAFQSAQDINFTTRLNFTVTGVDVGSDLIDISINWTSTRPRRQVSFQYSLVDASPVAYTTTRAQSGESTFTIPLADLSAYTNDLTYTNTGNLGNLKQLVMRVPAVGLGTTAVTLLAPSAGFSTVITENAGSTYYTFSSLTESGVSLASFSARIQSRYLIGKVEVTMVTGPAVAYLLNTTFSAVGYGRFSSGSITVPETNQLIFTNTGVINRLLSAGITLNRALTGGAPIATALTPGIIATVTNARTVVIALAPGVSSVSSIIVSVSSPVPFTSILATLSVEGLVYSQNLSTGIPYLSWAIMNEGDWAVTPPGATGKDGIVQFNGVSSLDPKGDILGLLGSIRCVRGSPAVANGSSMVGFTSNTDAVVIEFPTNTTYVAKFLGQIIESGTCSPTDSFGVFIYSRRAFVFLKGIGVFAGTLPTGEFVGAGYRLKNGGDRFTNAYWGFSSFDVFTTYDSDWTISMQRVTRNVSSAGLLTFQYSTQVQAASPFASFRCRYPSPQVTMIMTYTFPSGASIVVSIANGRISMGANVAAVGNGILFVTHNTTTGYFEVGVNNRLFWYDPQPRYTGAALLSISLQTPTPPVTLEDLSIY